MSCGLIFNGGGGARHVERRSRSAVGVALWCVTAFGALTLPAWAARFAPAAGGGSLQPIVDAIEQNRWSLLLIGFLLAISLIANILMIFALYRAQNQVGDALDALKHMEFTKEAAVRMLGSPKPGEAIYTGEEDPGEAKIEIIRQGF